MQACAEVSSFLVQSPPPHAIALLPKLLSELVETINYRVFNPYTVGALLSVFVDAVIVYKRDKCCLRKPLGVFLKILVRRRAELGNDAERAAQMAHACSFILLHEAQTYVHTRDPSIRAVVDALLDLVSAWRFAYDALDDTEDSLRNKTTRAYVRRSLVLLAPKSVTNKNGA